MKSYLVFYDHELEDVEEQYAAVQHNWKDANSKSALEEGEAKEAVFIYKLVEIHKLKSKHVQTEGVEVKYV